MLILDILLAFISMFPFSMFLMHYSKFAWTYEDGNTTV